MLFILLLHAVILFLNIGAAAECMLGAYRARKSLSLSLKRRAEFWLPSAIVLSFLSIILGWATYNEIAMVLGVLVGSACALGSLIMFSLITVRPVTLPEGTEEDYQRLIARFSLKEIASRSDYDTGKAILEELHERWNKGRTFPFAGQLNQKEWQYFHELQRLLWSFAETRPELICGDEWLAARQAEVEILSTAIQEAKSFAATNNVSFDRAEGLIRSAEFDLPMIQATLVGDKRGILPLRNRLDSVERELLQATRIAHRALNLLKARFAGTIQYDYSVRGLFYQGYRAVDEDRIKDAERLLKQAVHQAKHPDASAEPCDLPLALRALAVVSHQVNNPDQVLSCYTRVLEVVRFRTGNESKETAEALGLLAGHHFANSEYQRCIELLAQEIAIRTAKHPYMLTETLHTFERMAHAHEKLGEDALAEKALREAARLAHNHRCSFLGNHLEVRWALKPLIAFLERQGRHKEALQCYRQLRKADPRPILEVPSELQLFARVLRATGNTAEAEELERKTGEKEAEYSKLPERKWNCLEFLSTDLAISDSY